MKEDALHPLLEDDINLNDELDNRGLVPSQKPTYIEDVTPAEANYMQERAVTSVDEGMLDPKDIMDQWGVDTSKIESEKKRKKDEETKSWSQSVAETLEKVQEVNKEADEQMEGQHPIRLAAAGTLDASQSLINSGVDFLNFMDNSLGLNAIPDDLRANYAEKIFPYTGAESEKLARNIVSFGVSMYGAGAALKAGSKVLAGNSLARNMVAGAAADYVNSDANQGAFFISKLVKESPELQNSVIGYLATGDDRFLNRMKQVTEGAVIGGAFDGAFHILQKGLDFHRNTKIFSKFKGMFDSGDDIAEKLTKEQEQAINNFLQTKTPQTVKNFTENMQKLDLIQMNKKYPSLPPLVDRETAIEVAYKSGRITGNRVANLNVKQIYSEEARNFFGAMEEHFPEHMKKFRTGRMTLDEMIDAYNKSDVSLRNIIKKKAGEGFNFKEVFAIKDAVEQVSRESAFISKAFINGEVPVDVFLEQYSKQLEIQQIFHGAGETSGRSLFAFSVSTKQLGWKKRMEIMSEVSDLHLDGDYYKMATLMEGLTPEDIDRAGRKSLLGRWLDAFLEVRVNNFISKPATFMKNVIGNSAAIGNDIALTRLARKFAEARGADDFLGEAEAKSQILRDSLVDTIRFIRDIRKRSNTVKEASGAFKEGWNNNVAFGDLHNTKLPYDINRKALSSEYLDIDPETYFGKFIDIAGQAIRAPGAGLHFTDELYKTLNYRMELAAAWQRELTKPELRVLDEDSLSAVYENFMKNPPKEIAMKAAEVARHNTFTNDIFNKTLRGRMAGLARGVEDFDAVGKMLFPFMNTNLNMARYSFDMIPGANYLFKDIRETLKKGGREADLIKAKWSLGSMYVATGAFLYSLGFAEREEPSNPEAAKVWRENRLSGAIKLGDNHYQLNKLDPIGNMLFLGVEIAALAGDLQKEDQPPIEELAKAAGLAASRIFTPEMMVETMSDLMDIIVSQDVDGMKMFMAKFPSTFIPYGESIKAIKKTGEEKRQVYDATSFLNTMLNEARMASPFHSIDEMAIDYNLFGEPNMYETGLGGPLISFMKTKKYVDDPVYKELIDNLGMAHPVRSPIEGAAEKPLLIRKPPRAIGVMIGGAYYSKKLTPKQYSDYTRLAAGFNVDGSPLVDAEGNKIDSLHERLRKLIVSNYDEAKALGDFRDIPEERKKMVIQKIVSGYQNRAKSLLMQRYPEIIEERKEFAKERQQLMDIESERNKLKRQKIRLR